MPFFSRPQKDDYITKPQHMMKCVIEPRTTPISYPPPDGNINVYRDPKTGQILIVSLKSESKKPGCFGCFSKK
ncbi:hypothetical protein L5515_009241 [Caenorhabditis briggsae]|uniref:Uncharacterized protein n=1 Tax=Caenorhabditis briggsae TaxID=6238 RepID=A0AAE9JNP2_CAEBR|nr:hypothetical protein L5515_009241 [Caenorhabditis briggsae]